MLEVGLMFTSLTRRSHGECVREKFAPLLVFSRCPFLWRNSPYKQSQ